MNKETLKDFNHYLDIVSKKVKTDVVLFRGQRESKPLLPKIARDNPKKDTTSIEKEMLSELRRTGSLYLPPDNKDDWDLLVYAQHYGMATRLLDWSDNPLVALWFAAANQDVANSSFVYMFEPEKSSLLDRNKDKSPFTAKSTKVLRPNLNNTRIVAQSGWFTSHVYAKNLSKFIALEKHKLHGPLLTRFEITGRIKSDMLIMLDKLGINNRTLFPDIQGICTHMNWMFKIKP